jgi:hypothetical protein
MLDQYNYTEKKRCHTKPKKRFRDLQRNQNLFKLRMNSVSYNTIFRFLQKTFRSRIYVGRPIQHHN